MVVTIQGLVKLAQTDELILFSPIACGAGPGGKALNDLGQVSAFVWRRNSLGQDVGT